jgi:23S rRNA (cytosine1962-C5)-methyltransferase
MNLSLLRLKKGEDRRIRNGHPWIFSNEIDTKVTPIKSFTPGQQVQVQAADNSLLGVAYINPHSLICARLFSTDVNTRLDAAFFEQAIHRALTARSQLFSKPFYRLIFSEADQLPGVVADRYDDIIVLQINTAGMEQQKTTLVEALRAVLPDTKAIIFRNDSAIRTQEGLETYVTTAYGTAPDTILLEENNARFHAPLLKGQKTAWFYDHRMNRLRLKDYVKNANVLDVFSYLGAFGIQAAVYGAKQVDCIEASAFACDFIKQNATENNVSSKVSIINDDAFDAMKALITAKKQYDVVILDPPAFIKRSKDKKEGLTAYLRLNELALKLLAPHGILISCSCSMHLGMDELIHTIQRAAQRTQHPVQILERGHQGPDHPLHPCIPESDYLKAVIAKTV